MGRAEGDTAMTANAVLPTTPHIIVIGIIVVNIEGALVDTHLALDTPLRISFH